MIDNRRKILEVVDELERQGWRVRGGGSKHFVAYSPDRTVPPVTLPSTPSDWRGVLNKIAHLRRCGAKL